MNEWLDEFLSFSQIRRLPDLPLDPVAQPTTTLQQKKPLPSPWREKAELESPASLPPEKPPEVPSPELPPPQAFSPPLAQAAPIAAEAFPKISVSLARLFPASFVPFSPIKEVGWWGGGKDKAGLPFCRRDQSPKAPG